MKNLKLVYSLLIICFSVLLYQCQKENLDFEVEQTDLNSNSTSELRKKKDSDDELVLGEKLKNPYSVKNMEKAYTSLKVKGVKNDKVIIKSNYLYIRLLPKDDKEYDLINNDESIDTYEYPLDYEIVKQGNKYKDKSVGENKFTWIYCAVPVEKQFDKKIKVEVLEELFLPFGNGKEPATEQEVTEKEYLSALEDESLLLTGNTEEENKNARGINTWYASGRIRVWDDRINYDFITSQYQNGQGYVPVPGCLVRANRWFTTKTGITNSSGWFSINHGWGNGDKVNYSIKWDRDDFDIRDGSYGQAYYNGPKIIYQWNLDIQEASTPDNYIYAHVHRAAWYNYYNNTFNVRTPPTRTFFDFYGIANLVGQKMHLGAKQGGGRSHYFEFNSNWLASQVKLIFDLSDNQHDSRGIFGTTIHELTHASHWAMGMNTTIYCANTGQAGRLAESWATAVGWHVTRIVYSPPSGPNNFNNILNEFDHHQLTPLTTMNQTSTCASNGGWYTPIFIDLIDSYNQVIHQAQRPNDLASGYNIGQLESFLEARPTNWYMYRDFLENNSNNQTENAAVQLFSDYD